MGAAEHGNFASNCYLRAKDVWRGTRSLQSRRQKKTEISGSKPFGSGRDPKTLGNVLLGVTSDFGWNIELSRARLIGEWPEFVGELTAEHTSVVSINNGVLQVQCDSTTWTTELRRLRAEMLTRLLHEYPDAEIRDLRFLAPGAPTWQHGFRTVRGRGPRDTYG